MSNNFEAVNNTLSSHSRMVVSGRKEEIILRFTNFIVGLISNNKRSSIATVVRIVNDTAPRKLAWKYENDEITVNCFRPRVGRDRPGQAIEQLDFKQSPFLKPLVRLASIKVCPGTLFQFTLTDENRQLLATSNAVDDRPPYQIRFYCSQYNGNTSNLLVELPSVCELKVNDTVIQGSILRCLKGKPGTVNPPDLTIMTRKHALNNVELIYINSEVPFIASVYLVERTPVAKLIQTMKEERLVTKEQVLEKLQQTQEEDEIIMESETLSTKDPLAFTRINTPIRSTACKHLQCFDANIFLTMNEQTPTWSCPVCYRRIESWEDLFVDEYFMEMLHNTPKHIDSVRVESNGHITIIDENPDLADEESEEEEELNDKPEEKEITTILLDDDDDEEDEVGKDAEAEADKQQEAAISNDTIPNIASTPETSTANPDANASTSRERIAMSESSEAEQPPRKKAKSDVIDLTLDSGDEGDGVEATSAH
ncbi:MIZ-type zinc finger transcription factor [Mucor lusitanicus CBS 277.49]|uniref:MIZ-type zinc finger transcription factor n=1 Tax=Mucor lusitanicus CBS 277.49 TaxID=747725 RepID=A0A162YPF2_MUCCL|nr:MIZ-type zinc finger transcription factor [Mucor lusitanicus CBS 277.49]